ncbi:unnamed protein product [Diabrotica balteata]|uniref:Small ribosomal subunit protein uS15m n=1 Tax=Diabrotica balteata TaxID=107213 RepID=A0A9N9TE43_DIABA|nr:unnamed protein product [Diabrotica balteata]
MNGLKYLHNNSFLSVCINNIPNIFSRNYAFKSDLKIKWVRPEKIPCFKPQKSGDLQGYPDIDKKQFQLQFRDSKELQTADDNVKKLFTLEFAPRSCSSRLFQYNMMEKVRRHEHDYSTVETRIARWTGIIRAMQEVMERFPRNKKTKVTLKELIDRRKKHLKYLRRWDYKKFEWLLETLDIVYKPPPNHFHWITRKESLRKLTDKYCDGIKEDRLKQYRLKLETEQPAFLEEKIRALQFIRDEQKECGAEITITEEEIDEVKKQLEDLKKNIRENKTN